MITIQGERGRSRLGFISPIVHCEEVGLHGEISMAVDTGASTSCISESDAMKLGVDYTKLSGPEKIFGISGYCHCYFTGAVSLSFRVEGSEVRHVITLPKIGVLKKEVESETCPECDHEWQPRAEEILRRAQQVPSILGLDVLVDFKVRLTEKRVFLESD